MILELKELCFPLSIQDVQPTPVRAGHIWVKSATLSSQITKVKIIEAVNAGETDGTLMLVVGDLVNHSMSFDNTVDVTGGGTKSVSIADTISSAADWDILSKNGDIVSSYKINRPMVYSKVSGVLGIETAYYWNGSSWVLLSQKGTYIAYGINSTTKVNNRTENALTANITLSRSTDLGLKFSNDGTYLQIGKEIYKRNGDVFTLYFEAAVGMSFCLSGDGQTFAAIEASGSSSSYNIVLRIYKNNGTTFNPTYVVTVYGSAYSPNASVWVSDDGYLVLVNASISMSNSVLFSVMYTGSTYGGGTNFSTFNGQQLISSSIGAYMYNGYLYTLVLTKDEYYNTFASLDKYSINYGAKLLSRVNVLPYISGISTSLQGATAMTSDGYFFYGYNGSPYIKCYSFRDNIAYTVTVPAQISGAFSCIAASLNGDKLLVIIGNSIYFLSAAYNTSNKTVTLTLVNIVASGSSLYCVAFAPHA